MIDDMMLRQKVFVLTNDVEDMKRKEQHRSCIAEEIGSRLV